ncbi:unnamed protein product [Arctogadus glacialis]
MKHCRYNRDIKIDMSSAVFRLTESQQSVLRASDAAVAVTAPTGTRGPQATARAKRPEEVEKEARARVVSGGRDPGNPIPGQVPGSSHTCRVCEEDENNTDKHTVRRPSRCDTQSDGRLRRVVCP